MNETGRLIKTEADFDNAIWFKQWVEVWREGMVVDYGGHVEKQEELTVVINGRIFFKHNWDFRINTQL